MKWKSPQPRLPKKIREKIQEYWQKIIEWLFGFFLPSP